VSALSRLQSYVNALDLVGVYVAVAPDGRAKIGASSAPATAVKRLSGARLYAVRWCKRDRNARILADECRRTLARRGLAAVEGWHATDAASALKVIETVCDGLGVHLETDNDLRARADAAGDSQ
jgi:hypothetical protein